HISGLVEPDLIRLVQFRLQRRAAITRVTALPRPRDRRDIPVAGNFPDSMVLHVADVKRAVRAARDAVGLVQLRLASRPIVAGITGQAGSRESSNLPGGGCPASTHRRRDERARKQGSESNSG